MFLITGAGGFVGRALAAELERRGHVVRRALRRTATGERPPADSVVVGEIGADTDWTRALEGVDVVVHAAARAHVMDDGAQDPLAEYRRVNVAGTRRLAACAIAAGVRRLVLVSSIKVNGEGRARRYTETDAPRPEDAYGISKHEAEQALMTAAGSGRLEWVILRPPLVYGPRVRANFLRLMRAVDRGMPLPLGAVDNRRSLVYLGNLVDALCLCCTHAHARNDLFLVGDDEALSTPELIRRLAQALSVRPRLLNVPPGLLRLAARLAGRTAAVDRLLGSLEVDASKLRTTLGWKAPFSVDQGLHATAQWYRGRAADDALPDAARSR